MISINLPKKASLDDIVNRINSLKDGAVGLDCKTEVVEVSNGSKTVNMVLPYDLDYGSAVVYNNEIHILGGNDSSYRKYHYKWNGSSWTSVSTLPYEFRNSSAVVYNNEIHILSSYVNSSYYTKHYKWDGTSWTEVSTLPYKFVCGSAVVYNNEMHILGSSNSSYYTAHYKFNGTSWTSVSTLPYNFYNGSAVVYNNKIHILGSSNSLSVEKKHYKWNGSSWTSVSTLPYNFYNSSAVVYNNEIHLLGSQDNSYGTAHYKWDSDSWQNETIVAVFLHCFIYYLSKSTKIYCDTSIFTPDTSSVSLLLIENGYQVSETGNVILTIIDEATEIQKAHTIVYE